MREKEERMRLWKYLEIFDKNPLLPFPHLIDISLVEEKPDGGEPLYETLAYFCFMEFSKRKDKALVPNRLELAFKNDRIDFRTIFTEVRRAPGLEPNSRGLLLQAEPHMLLVNLGQRVRVTHYEYFADIQAGLKLIHEGQGKIDQATRERALQQVLELMALKDQAHYKLARLQAIYPTFRITDQTASA